MDTNESASLPNPHDTANPLSIAIWWWVIDLFKKSCKELLKQDDLYNPPNADKSNLLGKQLENEWKAELERTKGSKHHPSLWKTIYRLFYLELLLLWFVHAFLQLFLKLGIPVLLGLLLQYFQPESSTTFEKALIYAIGIIVATAVNAIVDSQYFHIALHIGGRIRIAISSVVFRKALRLSKASLGKTAPGKIVNLIASDVNRFDFLCAFINYTWSCPLSVVIVGYLLYNQAGYAGLIGIISVFVFASSQVSLSKLVARFRQQMVIQTDKRIRLMNEIISGIQVIKLYAWEKSFCNLIELVRRLELNAVKKGFYIRGITMVFAIFIPRIALYFIVTAMLLFGDNITAEKVYVCVSYLNMLTISLSIMYPRSFSEIAESIVSVKRLQNFLMLEEIQEINDLDVNVKSNYNHNIVQKFRYIDDEKSCDEFIANNNKNVPVLSHETTENVLSRKDDTYILDTPSVRSAVQLKHMTTKWNVQSSDTILDDVNLNIETGKLYIVIGMVGAGKSTLFSTILGETNIIEGSIEVNGNISYADQDSWIFGSTVRQNILFGQDFDKERYQRVVKVCALLPDLKQFPQGDQTIVGERGTSLSGGQKARVNLARSVYRDADIYLLDDPLSAVDSYVGKHLFEKCLQGYLGNKTRILATHQLQYIKNADAIILVDQGKTYQYNNYLELFNKHPDYSNLITNEKSEKNNLFDIKPHIQRQLSSSSMSSLSNASGTEVHIRKESENLKNKGDLEIKKNKKTKNNNLFLDYCKIGSNTFVMFFMLLIFILTQLTGSLTDMFVPVLITAEESRTYYKEMQTLNINNSNLIGNKDTRFMDEKNILPVNYYMYIFTGLISSILFLGAVRFLIYNNFCIRCSQRLHDLVFRRLIRTNMLFFDTNPSGNILNRFSKDLAAIDELLPRAIMDVLQNFLKTSASLIIPCIINPIFLVPISIIGALFYWVKNFYYKASRNLKKLEGATRSPVFTHLNTTLNGISTIRAYKAQKMLINEFDKLQDTHTSAWYMLMSCNSAFGFLLDFFGFILTTALIFSFLLFKEYFTEGQVGLAITQLLSIIGAMMWGIRQSTEVINQLTAVERVLEYKDLEPEPNVRDMDIPKTSGTNKTAKEEVTLKDVPKDWPRDGKIEFRNVCMRYDEGKPLVLKNLMFTILPTEKIGIVGRTGAGKSSLISALFRLARVEGVIEIDGIDTGTIALEDLRSRLSIIPQDPVLFSGTLRYNLDPFDEFSDETLWKVLDEVELKDTALTSPNILDSQIYDHGTNFSVGQRQLVCLARAILRNNRILVLDEATANVDPHTDLLIQRTIRTKFAQSTVLTVAHRLNTIIDSDRVLVMGMGEVLEFDHPHLLLQNERSQFTTLVKETGPAMYQQLREIAYDTYQNKCESNHL